MRGRKPKPTRLRILENNPGKRPLNDSEPQPRRCVPACPPHIDKEAKREWRRVAKELDACGLLTVVDRAALAAYCQAWSRWVKAEGILQKSGEVLKHPEKGVLYPNPYLAVANRALKQMHEFLSEFGMTPASRTRIHVARPAAEADELAAFLGGTG
jgi:P27 family predicted phage terminase small subunit